MANSISHTLYYVKETDYGVTPSNPAFTGIPITGCTMGLTSSQIISESIRDDRQLVDIRNGTASTDGDISCELQHGVLDDLIEAAMCGAWNSGDVKSEQTQRSFTFLRYFSSLTAGDNAYEIITGVVLTGAAFDVGAEKLSTVVFNCLGKDITSSATAPSGAVLTDVPPIPGYDSFTGTMVTGGVTQNLALTAAITLANGQAPRFVIGSNRTIAPILKRASVTGTITLHFEDHDALDNYYAGNSSSLVFSMVDPAGNTMQLNVPELLYTGGRPDVSGESDIILTLPFTGKYNAGDATSFWINATDA